MIPTLGMLLLSASSATAADRLPPTGGFGFNWLDPHSQCRKLTAKELAKAKRCTATDNAFGLDLKSRTCKMDAHVEYVVYATAAQCKEAFEAMQANGD